MGRREVTTTKAFLSRKVDHYRPSYGRHSQDFPRQCVFAGTTNADEYLKDETGNRRNWGLRVGTIDLDALKRDRDQLWAEAVHAYRAGETWWLDEETEKVAAEEQAERRVADPWEARVLELAERKVVQVYDKARCRLVEVPAPPVTVSGLLIALGVPIEEQSQRDANRVSPILKANGWERYQVRSDGKRSWAYRRATKA
jgi:predicted P-loop ATPase